MTSIQIEMMPALSKLQSAIDRLKQAPRYGKHSKNNGQPGAFGKQRRLAKSLRRIS